MHSILQQGWKFCSYLFFRFFKEDFSYRAAALTFTSLLSLVPLLVVCLTILSALPTFQDLALQMQSFIFKNFIPESTAIVKEYIQGFIAQAGKLPALGFIFLVVTAILMLYTMEQAFNSIWRIKARRHGISSFLLYWAVLTLSPILIGASIAVSSYVFSLPLVTDAAKILGVYEFMLALIPIVLTATAFTLMYIAVPNCYVKISHAVISGIVATLLFELARWGFTFYITSFPTYQLLYGALAALPLFLLWIYISWLIILFGALLTYSLTFHHTVRFGVQIQAFNHAVLWIERLWKAQCHGKVLDLAKLVKGDNVSYEIKPEYMLDALVAAKVILKTGRSYFLCVDLSHFSLADLYQALPWKLSSVDNIQACQYTHLQQLASYLHIAQESIEQVLQVPLSQVLQYKDDVK